MVRHHIRYTGGVWMVVFVVLAVHRRLAELFTVLEKRSLNDQEAVEMHHCLKANAKICWDMALQENLSLMASMTNDVDFQHEVCREIDRIHEGKKKKPGRKATD